MNLPPTAGSIRLAAAELPAMRTDLQDSSAAMLTSDCCVLCCTVLGCFAVTAVSLQAEASTYSITFGDAYLCLAVAAAGLAQTE
jgi:hypothetical protein